MNWRTENLKDLRLLERRGFTPLSADLPAGDGDLAVRIEQHNARITRATARLRTLADDRQRLTEGRAWRDRDSAELLAESLRLHREAWDALLELRRVLQERGAILEALKGHWLEQYRACSKECDQIVAAAEQRLEKKRLRLIEAVPATAGRHFAELVASEQTVIDARARVTAARSAFENAAAAHRDVDGDLRAVAVRQDELFRAMMSGPLAALSGEVR